ncbi:hypothetical protein OOT46_17790 [Aquabacterium sp. A7-Y]|uniref:hypothetical protein n=1 Tax=Aquabacterium sp. A7-Y TaxID=1349605 RepID=UPI00223D6892|nr:hypothetical protein [Aquabacterium sp. A7-Y]MCW7539693.1 hypothetical protein [Aquabacterium sp. A7-Y]
MKRLLTLRLEAAGCHAEAWLNGISVARATPESPRICLAVHEFMVRGSNSLELHIDPLTLDRPATDGATIGASVDLHLTRMGDVAGGERSRELARLAWAPGGSSEEEPDAPSPVLRQQVDLPLAFPRWRWLDAPVAALTQELQAQAQALLQGIALALNRGDADPWLALTRLAREELATAYQRDAAEQEGQLRSTLLRAPDGQAWQWQPPSTRFVLQPMAGGRLLECLDPEGRPALGARSQDQRHLRQLPLRLAWIDNRFYGLR